MGETTAIEWTNKTYNPWQGCHKVSEACRYCYMYREKKFYGGDPSNVVRSKTVFNAPLKWKDPALVFLCSWSDFWIEEADAWRPEVWDIIRRTPHLTYQIPTKRPERIAACLPPDWGAGYPNVWLGVSIENQEAAELRIPPLLRAPAALRFLSCEPLLGPINLRALPAGDSRTVDALTGHFLRHEFRGGVSPLPGLAPKIDWVIAGGESGGLQVRPTHPGWVRSLQAQCESAAVPFFLKQWGEWAPAGRHTALRRRADAGKVIEMTGKSGHVYTVAIPADANDNAGPIDLLERVGRERAGAELDGKTWKQMPQTTTSPKGSTP